MATYLKGSRDYIPQIQPFQPDFNFYNAVLQTKESQYQAGYDKLSKLYDTLLNSELSRDINIERRNKFFQQIGNDIKKISSLDLSLEQNVDAAYNVFKPFINDKNVVKDMAWTKMYNRELGKSEYYRNCTTSECKDQYWTDGVRALNYMRQDFSKATDDEAIKFQTPRYTPFVNVAKEASKLAKDMGVSLQYVTNDGKYIITTKNGEAVIPTLTDYFTSIYGNDPRVLDMYTTKGYLARKDYVMTNAEQFGSEEAAERQYLNEVLSAVKKQQQDLENQNNDNLTKVRNTKDALTESVKQNGVDMDDPSIAEMYANLDQQEQVSASNVNFASSALQNINDDAIADDDITSLRYRADRALASSLLLNDLYGVAKNYAMMTMEQKVEADPYALANFEHGLAMERLDKQHQNAMEHTRYKTIMDITKKDAEGEGNTKEKVIGATLGEGYVGVTSGEYLSTDPNVDLKAQFDTQIKQFNDHGYEQGAKFLEDMYNELNHIAKKNPNNAMGKYAQEQIRSIFGDTILNTMKDPKLVGGFDADGNLTEKGTKFLLDHMPSLGFIVTKANKVLQDKTAQAILFKDPNRLSVFNNLVNQKQQYDEFTNISNQVKQQHGANLENALNYVITEKLSDKYKGGILNTINNLRATVATMFTGVDSDKLADSYNLQSGVEFENNAAQRQRAKAILNPDKSLKDRGKYIQEVYSSQVGNQKIQTTAGSGVSTPKFIRDPITNNLISISNELYQQINSGNIKTYNDLKKVKTNLGYLPSNKDAKVVEIVSKSIGEEYDDFSSALKEVYNSGKPAAGVVSLQKVVGGQSSYSKPAATNIDPARFTSIGWRDGLSVFENYRNTKGESTDVRIISGKPNNIEKAFKDGVNEKLTDGAEAFLTKLFYTDWKTDDPNRPQVQFIASEIAYNRPDLTSYTFKVTNIDDYIKNNKTKEGENENMYDALDNTDGVFTLLIPRVYAKNTYMESVTRSPYEVQYDLNGKVSINRPDAGNISITKTGSGAKITGEFIYNDPITGAPQMVSIDNDGPIFIDGTPDIDAIVRDTQNEMKKIFSQNQMINMAQRYNKNLTYDINQYLNR